MNFRKIFLNNLEDLFMKISEVADINKVNLLAKENVDIIKYLDTSNLTEGIIDEVQILTKGKDKIPSRAKRKVKKDDILISTVRPNLKHYGLIKENDENLIVSTGFAVLTPNTKIVDPRYLYYYLTSENITNYLHMVACTSTTSYPSIKPSVIGDINIDLPTIGEQKKIGDLLSAIDDKIFLNNELNKELDELSQLIFEKWLNENEAKSVELRELCSLITDGSHSSPTTVETGFPMASVKDMTHFSIDIKKCRNISKDDYDSLVKGNCKPKINDILVAKDGSYLKHIIHVKEEENIVLLSSIAILRPNLNKIHPIILKRYLLIPSMKKALEDGYVTGTALKRIILKSFRRFPIAVPSIKKQSEIIDILNKLEDRIYLNVKENEDLNTLRDTLISQIFSGKIKIK